MRGRREIRKERRDRRERRKREKRERRKEKRGKAEEETIKERKLKEKTLWLFL